MRCRILKAGLDLEVLQRIAGREQAKSETVSSMTFSQTMEWYLHETEQVKRAAENAGEVPVINCASLLGTVYLKTGKTNKHDGSVVCALLVFLLALCCRPVWHSL